MDQSALSANVDFDLLPFAMVTHTFEGFVEANGSAHRHRKAQLAYCLDGVLVAETPSELCTIPAGSALWIPSGIVHGLGGSGSLKLENVYLDPSIATFEPARCRVIPVEGLMRELLIRFTNPPPTSEDACRREARLASVFLDELGQAVLASVFRPIPNIHGALR